MTLSLYSGGPKDVTGMAIRVGDALKVITEGYIRVDGALKQFYKQLTVTLSAYSVVGRGNSATVVPVTSGPVTAQVAGGTGSLSYVWSRTAADAQPWTINNPTSATASFTTDCDQGTSYTATFICTVTDQAGIVLASDPVTVECANIFYGGGYIGSDPPAPGTYYP